jgi:PAS domain S-box-containing protein
MAAIPAERQTSFGVVFERSANPMLLSDDMRHVVDANPAACKLLGYSRERMRNLSIDDLVAPEIHGELELLWIRFLKSGGQRGSVPFVTGKGRRIEAHISSTADIEPGLHLAVFPAAGIPLAGVGNADAALEGASASAVLAGAGMANGILTRRHVEVLTHLALGATVEEIAEALVISPETVRVHIRNARRRLGARSRSHAVALAVQRGAITP